MKDIITNVKISLRSKQSGEVYDAQYVVERPAGEFGLVWAWLWIDTEFGTFIESYKPTIGEAIDGLRAKVTGRWERA